MDPAEPVVAEFEQLDLLESVGLAGKAPTATGHADLAGLWRAGGRTILVAAGAILLVAVVVAILPGPGATSQPGTSLPASSPAPTAPDTAADSLGVELSDLTERWNEVTAPPAITKGIPRTPETGRFDAFTYRFNDSSLLAGAYDDRTEDLYALMVRSWLSDENAGRFVLHLCHVVHPHQPECLERYQQVGLGGATLESFRDLTHEAEWVIDGVRWSLEIEENIQTIRAIAPGGP